MSHSKTKTLTIYRTLLDIRDLIELFPNAQMRHPTEGIGRLQGSSFYPNNCSGSGGDVLVNVNPEQLEIVLEVAPGELYTPRLAFQVIPSREAAKQYAGRFGKYLPEAPLGPSEAAVALRKEIRSGLGCGDSVDDWQSVARLREVDLLLAAIDKGQWSDFKLPEHFWLSKESEQALLKIGEHRLLTEAFMAACDEMSPLPNMLLFAQIARSVLGGTDITRFVVTLARCRIAADLAHGEFDRADQGKINNSHFVSNSWYDSEKKINETKMLERLKQRFDQIDSEFGSLFFEEVSVEVDKHRRAINQERLLAIESVIQSVDEAAQNDDLTELSLIKKSADSEAIDGYAKKAIARGIDRRIKHIRNMLDRRDIDEAKKCIEVMKPYLIDGSQSARFRELQEECAQAEKRLEEAAKRLQLKRLEGHLQGILEKIKIELRAVLFKPAFSKKRHFDDKSVQLVLLWKFQRLFTASEARVKFDELLTQNDYDMLSFWSARRAELSVAEYLSKFHDRVIDVSIGQLNGTESAWKTHDIEADEHFFDVKNARASFSNKKNFSELCVPQFKKERQRNQSVVLVGAFSEYLSAWKIKNGERSKCLVLGFLSEEDLKNLDSCISSLTNGQLRLAFTSRTGRREKFFPGWMFEHPSAFYPSRAISIGRIEEVLAILDHHPELAEFIGPDFWLLQAAMSPGGAHRCFPEYLNWISPVVRLIKECGLTLRCLVLSVMVLSIHHADKAKDSFSPSSLKGVFNLTGPHKDSPLGIYDPLGYLETTINVFELIYENNRTALSQYSEFSLSAEGILRGRKKGEPWETIIAYCGGRLSSGVKCGQNPIHSGESKHCEFAQCRRLVCPSCGFCSKGCHGQKIRSALALEGAVHPDPPF
ncbi:MAG: hypothetical protein ACXIUB_04220 [Wenzhouxiangella sp.]